MSNYDYAFPSHELMQTGMTLRDYFAAAALASFGLGLTGMESKTIAELAWLNADREGWELVTAQTSINGTVAILKREVD